MHSALLKPASLSHTISCNTEHSRSSFLRSSQRSYSFCNQVKLVLNVHGRAPCEGRGLFTVYKILQKMYNLNLFLKEFSSFSSPPSFYLANNSINAKTHQCTKNFIYKVYDCAAYVCCNRQASDYDIDSLNSVIYLRN